MVSLIKNTCLLSTHFSCLLLLVIFTGCHLNLENDYNTIKTISEGLLVKDIIKCEELQTAEPHVFDCQKFGEFKKQYSGCEFVCDSIWGDKRTTEDLMKITPYYIRFYLARYSCPKSSDKKSITFFYVKDDKTGHLEYSVLNLIIQD